MEEQITVKVGKYDQWMVNEYKGTLSLVDVWEGRDGELHTKFCTIEKNNGETIKIPKGLGGRFDSLADLARALELLLKLVREADSHKGSCGPAEQTSNEVTDDIPF